MFGALLHEFSGNEHASEIFSIFMQNLYCYYQVLAANRFYKDSSSSLTDLEL